MTAAAAATAAKTSSHGCQIVTYCGCCCCTCHIDGCNTTRDSDSDCCSVPVENDILHYYSLSLLYPTQVLRSLLVRVFDHDRHGERIPMGVSPSDHHPHTLDVYHRQTGHHSNLVCTQHCVWSAIIAIPLNGFLDLITVTVLV